MLVCVREREREREGEGEGGRARDSKSESECERSLLLRETCQTWCQRDWYFIDEQPVPELHHAHPEGCAALHIVLVTVPRVSHSCEHFPDGCDLHLLLLHTNDTSMLYLNNCGVVPCLPPTSAQNYYRFNLNSSANQQFEFDPAPASIQIQIHSNQF